ncbi:MAG TPA: hypothetical protein VMT45_02680, partial [Thermoanaerobaculaceae bacterium]|nr:hypothetical protein [Thermoanaerobaculaceae bacterium]
EARAANKLARMERKHELRKLAKVERRAASGDRRSKAFVASQVALAKRGDKRAKSRVEKMTLARQVRLAAPSKRERRNLAQAGRLYSRAQKGDPRARRQIRVFEVAAKHGDPNAKRAVRRLKIAKAVEAAVATGAIVATVAVAKSRKQKKEDRRTVARVKSKMRAGTASREELAAGARAAKAVGDERTAGEMAMAAASAPAATEQIRSAAAVVSARQSGNARAKEVLTADLESAKTGDPAAITRTGNVVAANTIDDIQHGRPVSPAMRDAINLQARAAEGDPTARAEIDRITTAATSPDHSPEATAAAVTLAAAAVTAKALAAKPRAREELLQKVNEVPAADRPAAESELALLEKKADDGTITADEGQRAVKLAERLGKPKVAADIASKAPPVDRDTPLSSLPDLAQPPITGAVSLVRESLRALTLSTRDPLANYREGVSSRSRVKPGADTLGWSPFDWFRRHPLVAPATALAASATSFLSTFAATKQPKAAAPAAPAAPPAPAKAATEAPAAEPAAKTARAAAAEQSETSGSGDVSTDLLKSAVRSKRMSRADFNKVVAERAGAAATRDEKTALGAKLLKFLAEHEVKLSDPSSAVGADKTFKDYVSEALGQKKMSKRDFGRAVDLQAGPGATPQTRQAVGKKVIEFLSKRGVEVES